MKKEKQENDVSEVLAQKKLANRQENKRLFVLFISLVLDLLSFTLILPLLPSLLDYYGEHDKVRFILRKNVKIKNEFKI